MTAVLRSLHLMPISGSMEDGRYVRSIIRRSKGWHSGLALHWYIFLLKEDSGHV